MLRCANYFPEAVYLRVQITKLMLNPAYDMRNRYITDEIVCPGYRFN
jgi:hypothetical protein